MPPAVISVAGLLFTGVAFVLLYRGWLADTGWGWMRAAGAVILLAAVWDTLDGEVARARNITTAKGAFLDSVLDRVSEFTIFLGLLLFLKFSTFDSILLFTLLFTSLAVSYIRARAEGVGIDCKVGLFDRPLRVVIIGVALIALPQYMNWIVRFLVLGTFATALQRFIHVLTRKEN